MFDSFKNRMIMKIYVSLALLLVSACMSTSDGERLRVSLFDAQKRLLELERNFDKKGKESENKGMVASKMLASSSVKVDKMEVDLLHIRGEIDMLRMGVMTGELPGNSENTDSVAKSIHRLEQKLNVIEATQLDVLELLKNNKSSKKDKSKKRPSLESLSSVEKAFKKKQYLYVSQDVPNILKKKGINSNKKGELQFLYAESLFKLGRLRDAALAFSDLQGNKNVKTRNPNITLRLGDCFRLLGDSKAASIYYNEVLQKYPESSLVVHAKEQLDKLAL